jgi:tyrosyl-tRNA synthetase
MSFQYDFNTLKSAILFNTVEVLPTDPAQLDKEIQFLVDKANSSGQPIRHYIGFEISGRVHLGTGIMTGLKIKKLQEAGVVCSIWLADFHTLINNKLDGKLETIQKVRDEYFAPVMKASLEAVGCDVSKVEFMFAEETYDKKVNDKGFFAWDIQIANQLTLARVLKSMSVTGKTAGDGVSFGTLRYPPMQVADAFFMQTHLVHAGMDQRKCHVLMREVSSKLDYTYQLKIGGKPVAPIAIHHTLLLGLSKPIDGEASRMRDEILEDNKMSKSKPDTCIFVEDSIEDIERKIKKAYCPMPMLDTQTAEEIQSEQKLNPILNWIESMIMPIDNEFTIIDRDGNSMVYSNYQDLYNDYCGCKIHPSDLKNALTKTLIKLLTIPRTWAEQNQETINLVKSFQKK